MTRRRGPIAVGALAAAVAAALGWAGATVFAPPPEVADLDASPIVTARVGEVGQTVALRARAEWRVEAAVANRAEGTVTSVEAATRDRAHAGDVLLRVNLRPVVAARGPVPMFRALARGVEGPDVAQLQGLLAELGLYRGPHDGRFGPGTQAAVEAWQRRLGIAPDGMVRVGELVFLPRLPALVRLADGVTTGAVLAAGEPLLEVLADEPVLVLPLTDGQAARIPDGAGVRLVRPDGGAWAADVADRVPAETGIELRLGPPSGATTICGDDCGMLDPRRGTLLDAEIVLVPPTSGVVIPSAAILTRADGRTVVIDETGAEHPVTVVASARGESVVTGIAAGDRIRVPAS